MFKRWLATLAAALCLTAPAGEIVCEAKGFRGHLQGIAADESGIYWSFYDTVVKTDWSGRELARVAIPRHAGTSVSTTANFTSRSSSTTKSRRSARAAPAGSTSAART